MTLYTYTVRRNGHIVFTSRPMTYDMCKFENNDHDSSMGDTMEIKPVERYRGEHKAK